MRVIIEWIDCTVTFLHTVLRVCLSLVTLPLKKILLRSKAQAPYQLIKITTKLHRLLTFLLFKICNYLIMYFRVLFLIKSISDDSTLNLTRLSGWVFAVYVPERLASSLRMRLLECLSIWQKTKHSNHVAPKWNKSSINAPFFYNAHNGAQ